MALTRIFNPTLDGGLVQIGNGTVRKQAVRIEAGEYATPIWLETESGLVVKVASLPWQGVLTAGEMRVLSSDPGAGEDVALTLDSRWDTSLGSTDDALLDGPSGSRVWDGYNSCGGAQYDTLEVVDASTVGWTGAGNALRITGDCGAVIKNPFAPANTSFWYRMYIRTDQLTSGWWAHPNSVDYTGDIDIVVAAIESANPGWYLRVNVKSPVSEFSDHFPWYYASGAPGGSNPIELDAERWYRFEGHIDYQDGGNNYKAHFWLTDDGGVQIGDESDFYYSDPVGHPTIESVGDHNAETNFAPDPASADPLEEMREIGFGSEDSGNPPPAGETYYMAQVALSTEGRIGSQGGPF